jgi:UDP-N-acetylglucosamine 2-epimerase (non-hydrolysing)
MNSGGHLQAEHHGTEPVLDIGSRSPTSSTSGWRCVGTGCAPRKVRVLCIAGARPNFVKVAPLVRAFRSRPLFDVRLVHTGQHYDSALSQLFFEEFNLPRPDAHLEVGSGTHAYQTAELIKRFEPVLIEQQPEVVLVVGDVNSTMACAIVAAKFVLNEPFLTRTGERRRPLLVHVEAGLRSFDHDMPEETNRRLTDAISDLLYVSEPSGLTNLKKEGIPDERVVLVGNVMIDSLLAARQHALGSSVLTDLGLTGPYGVVTLHRPSNVDDRAVLEALLHTLDDIARQLPLVFPVHPRTRVRLQGIEAVFDKRRWRLLEPLGYGDFIRLLGSAQVVFTDSGGVQEETTVLGIPCVTLRNCTERPITVEQGTNQLVGTKRELIQTAFRRAMAGQIRGQVPEHWDGKAAERIVAHLQSALLRACA